MSMLAKLFESYGTDKARNGYHKIYEPLLVSQRLSITRVLEIGIGTLNPAAHSSMVNYAAPHYKPGGSLRAWRDYFPNAEIVGLDVEPDTQFTEDRITTWLGDSTDPAVAQHIANVSFDLIIDDGDHARQFETMLAMWPKLKIGGIYAIEDVWGTSQSLMVMTRNA